MGLSIFIVVHICAVYHSTAPIHVYHSSPERASLSALNTEDRRVMSIIFRYTAPSPKRRRNDRAVGTGAGALQHMAE